MNIDTSIFKAYDIRGIYPTQLNEELAYKIARAYASWLIQQDPEATSVAVGGDMRLSTESLKKEVIRGLTESGLNVDDFGLVSSPTFYFAVANFGYHGGLQVSASHNPKEYNGIKVVSKNSNPVGRDNGLFTIRDMVVSDNLGDTAEKSGALRTPDELPKPVTESIQYYENFSHVNLQKIQSRNFKIVHDAANAMGILDFGELYKHLGLDFVPMNFELDGTFPVHEADPLKPENVVDLQKAVVESKADLGIATDGDADRIFFIDETGERVPQAIIRGVLAQIILKQNPGAAVCYDIRPGKITEDMIREAGGKPIITPVGHTLIKNKMDAVGAIFGGESSGHFFYKLPIGIFEQPILVALNILNWLAENEKSFSELIAPYKKYVESGEINFKVATQDEVVSAINKIKEQYKANVKHEFDGVFVEFPDVWFLVRGSNTEPLLRISLEALNESSLNTMQEKLLNILGQS